MTFQSLALQFGILTVALCVARAGAGEYRIQQGVVCAGKDRLIESWEGGGREGLVHPGHELERCKAICDASAACQGFDLRLTDGMCHQYYCGDLHPGCNLTFMACPTECHMKLDAPASAACPDIGVPHIAPPTQTRPPTPLPPLAATTTHGTLWIGFADPNAPPEQYTILTGTTTTTTEKPKDWSFLMIGAPAVLGGLCCLVGVAYAFMKFERNRARTPTWSLEDDIETEQQRSVKLGKQVDDYLIVLINTYGASDLNKGPSAEEIRASALKVVGKEKAAQMREVFRKYDENNSGGICRAELHSALLDIGYDMNPREITTLMARFDLDKSGQIDLTEFEKLAASYELLRGTWGGQSKGIGRVLAMSEQEDLSRIFKKHDLNGSGAICKAELHQALCDAGLDITKREAKKVLQEYDIDESGTVDFYEFEKLIATYEILKESHTEGKHATVKCLDVPREKLEQVFNLFDTNRSGSLSRSELLLALKRAGVEPSRKEVKILLDDFSEHTPGKINLEEFIKLAASSEDLMRCWGSVQSSEQGTEFACAADYGCEIDELGTSGRVLGVVKEEQLLQVFNKYDYNNSGGICKAELRSALQEVGVDMKKKDVRVLMERFDKDRSGEVDLVEFESLVASHEVLKKKWLKKCQSIGNIDAVSELMTLGEEAKLEAVFQRHDVNASGGIDRKELLAALREAGLDMSKKDAKRVLENFDTDKSGQIELTEFIKLVGTYEVLREIEVVVTKEESDAKHHDAILAEIFKSHDLDNSGSISRRELEKALSKAGVNLKRKEVKAILATFDENGSEELCLGEFEKLVEAYRELVHCWGGVDFQAP